MRTISLLSAVCFALIPLTVALLPLAAMGQPPAGLLQGRAGEIARAHNELRDALSQREFANVERLWRRLEEFSRTTNPASGYRDVELFDVARELYEAFQVDAARRVLEIRRLQMLDDRRVQSPEVVQGQTMRFREILQLLALCQASCGQLDESARTQAEAVELPVPGTMSAEQVAAWKQQLKQSGTIADVDAFVDASMRQMNEGMFEETVNSKTAVSARLLLMARRKDATGVETLIDERLSRMTARRGMLAGLLAGRATLESDPSLAEAALPALLVLGNGDRAASSIVKSWKFELGQVPVWYAESMLLKSASVSAVSDGQNRKWSQLRNQPAVAMLSATGVRETEAAPIERAAELFANLKSLDHDDLFAINRIRNLETSEEFSRLRSSVGVATRETIARRYSGEEVDRMTWMSSPEAFAQQQAQWQRIAQAAQSGRSVAEVDREIEAATRTAEFPHERLERLTGEMAEYLRSRVDSTTARKWNVGLRKSTGRELLVNRWVELDAVRSALSPGEYLVELAVQPAFAANAEPGRPLWKGDHYYAWIIPPAGAGPVTAADLGPVEPIDAAIQEFRNAMVDAGRADGLLARLGEAEAEKKLLPTLQTLRQLLWDPVSRPLAQATSLAICPDGPLWLLPWDALRISDDQYLVERYPVRYVVSARDVLTPAATGRPAVPVIFADPAFDDAARQSRPMGPAASRGVSRPASRILPPVPALPGTAAEAAAVRQSLGSWAGQEPRVYLQSEAAESRLFELRSPHTLVIASHGFFLKPEQSRRQPAFQDPFELGGILLAGCNDRAGQLDDGVVTALEAMQLDLSETRLVVLSACETGLGQVRHGEGVAGLRQAFLTAGARTVVATLWEVPDLESARVMDGFFREAAGGQPLGQALRDARLQRITSRREKFGAAHPFFWAAFTLTGAAGGADPGDQGPSTAEPRLPK